MRRNFITIVIVVPLAAVIGIMLVMEQQVDEPHEDAQMAEISAAEYLESCKRRFGTANPERMQVPVWEWMVRTQNNTYLARKSLGLESNYDTPGNPDWCFDRMGLETAIKL